MIRDLLSLSVKSGFCSLLNLLGVVDRKIAAMPENRFFILMYHRIIDPGESKIYLEAGMFVPPELFYRHIDYIRSRFDVVHLEKLYREPRIFKKSSGKPLCALTFDDGWVDFYQNAFPVLKKFRVPATVFLPTGYIDSHDWFWTDRLAYLLEKIPRPVFIDFLRQTMGEDDAPDNMGRSFEKVFEKTSKVLSRLKNEQINRILRLLASRGKVELQPPGRAFLNWGEVRAMADSKLVAFGSHTHSHRIMSQLSDREISEELILSRDKLLEEKAARPNFIPFAYPNGVFDKRAASLVEKSGCHMAVTTKTVANLSLENRFMLGRVGIHRDMTFTSGMLGARIIGII